MKHNYSRYSDAELYKLLSGEKTESEPAFAELYVRYSQKIYAYCIRVLGNSDDAMDVFQETFLSFYKSATMQKKMDSIFAFLLIIARNLCINYKRNNKSATSLDDFLLYSDEKNYEDKELLQLISTALEFLEFEHREAFILRLYQGLSYPEIAELQNETISTVRNRVWRAKEKIKNILSPYLEDLSNN